MRGCASNQVIERLEERRMMSATVVDGELQIAGTEEKDVIVVSLNAADDTMLDVKEGKTVTSFDLADVTKVTADLLGGNDKFTVKENNGPIYLGFVVYGGDGNDAITTASGNDLLDGGDGNDKLTGGSGDDQILGGEGNDRLLGGDDDDQLEAGGGKDKVDGAAGDDNLDGGGGKDNVKAGVGEDRVATDDSNPSEVHVKSGAEVTAYQLADVNALPDEINALIAEINQHLGSVEVVRAEKQNDQLYSVYYRWGTDPQTLKIELSLIDGVVDLVTRQVSMQEARSVAADAFSQDVPNLGVVSVFQHPHNVWDVRYRDLNGELQTVTTDQIIWGQDDLDQDQDNDGRRDQHEGGDDNSDPSPNP